MLDQPFEAAYQVTPKRTLPQEGCAEICDDAGQGNSVTHPDAAHIIAEIRIQWRMRQNWHRAEKSLTLQIRAICRAFHGGSITESEPLYKEITGKSKDGTTTDFGPLAYAAAFPLIDAFNIIKIQRTTVEKRLCKLVKQLPIYAWMKETPGIAEAGIYGVVGEAGDLSNYSNPAKLWKRFGMGLVGGEPQRKCKDAIKAIAHGYSPARRAAMWVTGVALLKTAGPYRELYLERKQVEHAKAIAEGLIPVTTSAGTVKSWEKLGLELLKVTKIDQKLHRSAGHMARRAQRYMEKRLLRNMWRAWRGQTILDTHRDNASPEIAE